MRLRRNPVYQIPSWVASNATHVKYLTKHPARDYVSALFVKSSKDLNKMPTENNSDILAAIRKRRSIREFTDEPVDAADLRRIVEAGIWAPSGLNNQPWRFVIILDPEIRRQLATLTRYRHIVEAAGALIAVYLDAEAMYNQVKDHQAAGACLQNMLLATEALGLGGVWLGEILNNKTEVNRVLGLGDNLDLMGLVAIGHPLHHQQKSTRKPLTTFIVKEI